MTSLPPEFVSDLRDTLGPEGLIEDAAQLAPHLQEWRGKYQGKAEIMAQPSSAEQAAAVVKLAARDGIALVPQGGNTGLVGGSLPGLSGRPDLLISSKRLNQISAPDIGRSRIIAGAGATIHQVQEAAASAGVMFPLSLASEGSCTVGGTIATNAGGVHVIRYGTMRALVAGIEAVLPTGEIVNTLNGLEKDNRGPHIASLFAGSEGTLGMITAASLRLFPAENHHLTLWLGVETIDQALEILAAAKNMASGQLSAFEIMSSPTVSLAKKHIAGAKPPIGLDHRWHALIEFGSTHPAPDLTARLESYLAKNPSLAGTIAQDDRQRQQFWRLREGLSEAQKLEGVSVKHDISLPQDQISEFVDKMGSELEARWPGSRMMVFGHLGDGNLHFNLMQPPGASGKHLMQQDWQHIQSLVHDAVTSIGGSLSAEHGIGRMKRDDLARLGSTAELQLLRQIKRAIDPDSMWNPGVLL